MAKAKYTHQQLVFHLVKGKPEYHDRAIDMWSRLNALPANTDPMARAKELVYLVEIKNKTIALTTAHPIRVKNLNNNYFYNFRVLIDPAFRLPGFADKLCVLTRDFLSEHRNASGVDCIGMITLVQNEHLKLYRNEMVWPSSGFTYIGKSKAGHHIRILYFPGARI